VDGTVHEFGPECIKAINYDYNHPIASYDRRSPTVLHFTQVVWRASQQLGCGVANCGGQNLYVCRYTPRGNFNGDVLGVLATNVPRSTCNAPPQVSIGDGTFSAIASTPELVGARLPPRWGAALFQATSDAADRTAVNNCDGGLLLRGCLVVFRTTAPCVAYAESSQGNFSAAADSLGLEGPATGRSSSASGGGRRPIPAVPCCSSAAKEVDLSPFLQPASPNRQTFAGPSSSEKNAYEKLRAGDEAAVDRWAG